MSKELKTSIILDVNGKAFVRGMTDAEKALESMQKTAKTTGAAIESNTKKTKRGLQSISQQLARTKKEIWAFLGISSVGAQIKSLVGSLSGVAQATDRWQSRLTVATGSAGAAAKEIAFVRAKAKELHLSLRETAEGYSSFATAAKLAGMQTDNIRQTFSGVSQAAMAMKLSADQQQRALVALSQMASKGVVSMEELRQQLGEAIPGAFSLAAKSMGMTEQAFSKAVAQGQILAVDLLPKLGTAMQNTFADAKPEGFVAAISDMKTAWFEFNETLLDSGAKDALAGMVNAAAKTLKLLSDNLGETVYMLGIAMGASTTFYAAQKFNVLTSVATGLKGVSLASMRLSATTLLATARVRALNLVMMANPFVAIAGAISMTIGYLIAFKDKIKPVAGSIASLGDYAQVAFNYIGTKIAEAMDWLSDFSFGWNDIGEAVSNLTGVSKDTFKIFGEVINQFIGWLKTPINSLIGLFVGGYNAVIAMWENFPNALNGIAVDAVNWVLESINKFVRGAAGLLNKIPGLEIDVSKLGFDKLENKAESSAQKVYDAFSKGFNKDYLGDAAKFIGDQFDSVVGSVTNKLTVIGETWSDLAEAEAYQRMTDPINDMNDSTAEIAETLGKLPPKVDNVGNSTGKAGKNIKGMGKAAKQAADELAKMKKAANDAAKGVFSSLFPAKQLLIDMQKDAKILGNAIDGNAKEAMEAYGVSVADVEKKQVALNKIIKDFKAGVLTKEQAKKAFDDMKKGIEGVKEETKETSSVLETQFKRAVESIDQSFADLWQSVLSGGKVSFKSLADSLKNILAETLHGLTTKRLTGWVMGLFSGGATMDSVTGQVKKDKTALDILGTLKSGFDSLDKTFSEGLQNLFGMEVQTAKMLGSVLGGASVGASVGGMASGLMGGDTLTGSLLGSVGGALGKMAGAAIVNSLTTATVTSVATATGTLVSAGGAAVSASTGAMLGSVVPVIGTIIGAALGAVIGKALKKKGKSRTWMAADGTETDHVTKKGFGSDATREPISLFWQDARGMAKQYGVQFAQGLSASFGLEERSQGLTYFFDLLDKNGQLIKNYQLIGDDIKDPKKFADTLAKMQIEALATADWSGVSAILGKGVNLANDEGVDSKSAASLYEWMSGIKDLEALHKDAIGTMLANLSAFKGGLEEFKQYTAAIFDVAARYGKNAVDQVVMYAAANPVLDATEIATGFNTVTYGMEMLKQKVDGVAASLLRVSPGLIDKGFVAMTAKVIKAFGGVEKATKAYATIFNVVATDTHKAGLAYQMARAELDKYNQLLGLSGENYINNIAQLREYVANLDPLSDNYAQVMSQVANLAVALTGVSNAAKYFEDAISGINQTIEGLRSSINRDLMTEKELYTHHKSKAEAFAKSISTAETVEEVKEANAKAVHHATEAWRMMGDAAKAKYGESFKAFLNELETLATGRINELQNQYGAKKPIEGEYTEIKEEAQADEGKAISTEAINHLITQQKITGEKQAKAGEAMDKAATGMGQAVQTLSQAASSIAGSAAEFAKGYSVDVTVHSTSESSEMT